MIASWRTAAGIGLGLVIFGCATGGPSGTGDDGTGDTTADPPFMGSVSGLFGADEAWSIGSPTFILGGYGNKVEYALAATDTGDGTLCLGVDPDGGLGYDSGTLGVDVAFRGLDSGDNCRVKFTVPAEDCAPGVAGVPMTCDVSESADGDVTVGSASSPAGTPRIVRFDPCPQRPTSLDDAYLWAILSVHPIPAGLINGPEPLGAIVVLGRDQNGKKVGTVLTGSIDANHPIGCVDETYGGSVEFDGTRLVVDVQLDGKDNSQGLGTANACTITFDGTASYCAIVDPNAAGSSGTAGTLLRIDGSGRWTQDEKSGDLSVLYLTTQDEPANGGGLPGGVKK